MAAEPFDGGQREILTDVDRPSGFLLLVDRVRQSYVDLDDPVHLEFDYARALGDLVDALPPGPIAVVHLGGGAGTLARYVAAVRPGSTQVLVEPDAAVTEFVRRRLPFRPGTEPQIVGADARAAVAGLPDRSADLVVLDAFHRGAVPAHLTTREFFVEIDRILRPAGIVAVNVIDGPGWRYARRLVAALHEVWPELAVRAEPSGWAGWDFGNVVVAAGRELPIGALLDDEPRALEARTFSGAALAAFLEGAAPLTDADPAPSPQPPDSDWRL